MKTILVVEDDPILRRMLHETLAAKGYHVLEAANGVEALEQINSGVVDLLITDRAMPKMDGLELLKNLRTRRIEIPVLVISVYGEERLWGQAIGLGAQDYILKPFSAEDVLKFVKKHLPEGKR